MTSVKEADVVDVAESVGPVDRLHNLLLAMTGRVDDDAINSAREMLGIGQLDAAAEFLTGCLLAGRIPVNSTEQYHLRRILDEARSDQALVERLQVVESLPTDQHRFSDQDESDADLLAALEPVAGRLGGVRALWCAWRVTPAGVTYGAVPQRVLLAEVGPDGSLAAAGYQLIEALRRAGIGCSVEVFSSGADLPAYHRNALATARRVHLDMSPVAANRNGANRARAPRTSSGGDSGGSNDLPSEQPASTAEPVPEPAAGERPPAAPVPESTPGPGNAPEAATAPGPSPAAEPVTAAEREESGPVGDFDGVQDDRERFDAWEAEEPVTAPSSETPIRETPLPEAPSSEVPSPDTSEVPSPEAPSLETPSSEVPSPETPVPETAQEDVRASEHLEPEVGSAEPDVSSQEEPATETEDEADQGEGSKNMRVPAAVDAKLTNRERNLLRKLHEELAQREQDRDGNSGEQHQEAWTAMPGTGGFPPMGAGPAPANTQAENKQP